MRAFIFAFIFLFVLIISSYEANSKEVGNNAKEVKIYYFHGPIRCPSDLQIEADSRESVNSNYSEELKLGKITFQVLDFIEEGNEHFIDEFNLETQTLIIVLYEGGIKKNWKSLEKIWAYVGNYPEFSKYIIEEVNQYLK